MLELGVWYAVGVMVTVYARVRRMVRNLSSIRGSNSVMVVRVGVRVAHQ